MNILLKGLVAAISATILAACNGHAQQNITDTDWNTFVERYIDDYFEAHPAFAVMQGRHEFDGRLPDWSREGIETEVARLKNVRGRAMAFTDLQAEQAYQRNYLVAATDRLLWIMDVAAQPYNNPAFYFDWMADSLDPAPYITLEYAPLEQRMRAYIQYALAIPRAVAQIRDNLQMPMARTLLQYGIDSFGGYATFFANDVPLVFANVADEDLQTKFEKANGAAVAAMRGLTDYLVRQRGSATDNFALGTDRFRAMLYAMERVDLSLDDLEAIGRADMRHNQQALKAACAEFAPGASVANCFIQMAERKPSGGPVIAARSQLKETRAFLDANNLISIPGDEAALVKQSPPYARSNSAYINIPGPYEKDQPSVYYISPPNPTWTEEIQAAYIPGESDLLFTSVHEVWPGHFLNFLHAKRSGWIFGRLFVTYAYAEGWAHYAEEMMLDAGLRNASPETRIGQLANALLRNARFLSALGLHTRGMTVEESKRLFMEEAFQDPGTAEQQANRGTYDPAYLNYTLGKLMIMQLREDWVAERGGRDGWKDFHDKFLSYGGPPIPMVRAQMLGETPETLLYQR